MTRSLNHARVDVLIPHFNDAAGLARSLESVKSQNWSHGFRIVVVDDGSKLHELEQVRSHLEGSGMPFHLAVNGKNRGRPYTRNRLLSLIDSPYVAWLDAGDSWYPEKTISQYERLRDLASGEHALDHVWITCDYDWQWLRERPKAVAQRTDGDQLGGLMEGRGLRAYLWTLFSTRAAMTLVGPFDERLPRLQDLDFFLRFVERGGRLEKPLSAASSPLCLYRKSDVGRDARQIFVCNRYIIEKHRTHYLALGNDFYEQSLIRARVLAGRFAKNNKDYLLAARYWGGAVIENPIYATRFVARKIKETLRK